MLNEGNFKITALTRADSTSKFPEGVQSKTIDYKDGNSLIAALRGQDALVITMSTFAPPGQQNALLEAAAEAEVPWVIPNDYGYDHSNTNLANDTKLGRPFHAAIALIEKLGKSSWIGISCGFWYEYSLSSGPALLGFDFRRKAVSFYDDGNTAIPTSTLAQTGRAVAKILSLPIIPETEVDKSTSLADYKNKSAFICSFILSQRDIFNSLLRVTGTSSSDWQINYEPSQERYQAGVQQLESGNRSGFVKLLYSRVFYPDGGANFSKTRTLSNEILGLPTEDLDEHTKLAAKMAETNELYLD